MFFFRNKKKYVDTLSYLELWVYNYFMGIVFPPCVCECVYNKVWSGSTLFAIPYTFYFKNQLHKKHKLGQKMFGIKSENFLDIYHM